MFCGEFISDTYDAIIVGAGLSGSVIARYLAQEHNKKVLVLERRNHVAGNLYDSKNDVGILIQKYGPHVFHTSDDRIISYIYRFAKWIPFSLRYKTSIKNRIVSNSPNFETIDTFFPNDSECIKQSILSAYPGVSKITYNDLCSCQNPLVKQFADFLYEYDFRPYTEKQWGNQTGNLDRSVFDRVPFYLSYHELYWDDKYQLLPCGGFTNFISEILNHPNISLKLSVNALDYLQIDMDKCCVIYNNKIFEHPVIYTGAIDELLQYKYGRLPYRSLRFEYLTYNINSYQEEAVVAYPSERYTRISEYKKMPPQDVGDVTTIGVEYPAEYPNEHGSDPYYPIPSADNYQLYEIYRRDCDKIPNLILCGRLAEYKYYNMDEALTRALEICDLYFPILDMEI